MTEDPERAALDAAVRILARRGHGRTELSRKLRARGHAEDALTGALVRLEELGYLEPDRTLAVAYARELARKRGATPRAVEEKLRQRGFEPQDAEAAVADAFSDWDARLAAKETIEGQKDPHKAARMLSRRGFPSDAIVDAIRSLELPDDLESIETDASEEPPS